MPLEVTKKLFTTEEYHRMGEAGILREDDRVELIAGEVIRMSPIGHRHSGCVNRANMLLIEALGRRVVLSPQNPVLLSDWTEPQPDIVVLKPRSDFYSSKHPTPGDVLILIEIADSSLAYDKSIKLPHYAAAGIPEVWIEDLQNELLLVYLDPACGQYATCRTLRAGDSISPCAFPDVTLRVGDLLGE